MPYSVHYKKNKNCIPRPARPVPPGSLESLRPLPSIVVTTVHTWVSINLSFKISQELPIHLLHLPVHLMIKTPCQNINIWGPPTDLTENWMMYPLHLTYNFSAEIICLPVFYDMNTADRVGTWLSAQFRMWGISSTAAVCSWSQRRAGHPN